jgi:Tol biopolymer transport system component
MKSQPVLMKLRNVAFIAASFSVTLLQPMLLASQQIASGSNGQIAFTQGVLDFNGGAPANIFTADSDGSNIHQLPLPEGTTVEIFSGSVWSPDGTKLLISHTLRLDNTGQCCFFQPATVAPDGSGFNQLIPTTPPGGPSANGIDCEVWLPDQTRILCNFNDSATQNAGIFAIRASDGGDPVRLTTNPYAAAGGQDQPTDISPDGKRFAFLRYRNVNLANSAQQVAVFVANMDGTGAQQVTPYGLAHAHEFTSAQWSPDGATIISQTHEGRLFTVQPDGARLTPIHLQIGTGNYQAFEPHWSPDGSRILFCMFINGGEGIYSANPDGTDVVQIAFTTDFNNFYNGPDWGRDPAAQ